MIKAILLDIDDTLLDFDRNAQLSLEYGCKELGIPYRESFCSDFHRVNDFLWEQVEKGTLSRDHLYEIRFELVFKEWKVVSDPHAFESFFRKGLCTFCAPMEGAYDLLEHLRGKYTLCIASNSAYQQQVTRLTEAKMIDYFSHLFISEQIGFSKPSKEFFDVCLKALTPIKPEEMIMIGDSPSADIRGAKKVGIQTCWFAHGKRAALSCEADYRVSSLREIIGIL